jgi:hypothetical protein
MFLFLRPLTILKNPFVWHHPLLWPSEGLRLQRGRYLSQLQLRFLAHGSRVSLSCRRAGDSPGFRTSYMLTTIHSSWSGDTFTLKRLHKGTYHTQDAQLPFTKSPLDISSAHAASTCRRGRLKERPGNLPCHNIQPRIWHITYAGTS